MNDQESAVSHHAADHPVRVGLESVVVTELLRQRSTRAPDYAAENRALHLLARALAESPQMLPQKLVDFALELTGAHSAGLSVLEEDGQNFRWWATAGEFFPFAQNTLPSDFSPCGLTIQLDAPQLMVDPERFYSNVSQLRPHISEVLLVPFHRDGKPVGTVWVVAHSAAKRFDSEDARLVASLSAFASAGVQTLRNIEAVEASRRSLSTEADERKRAQVALSESEDRFRTMADGLPLIVWVHGPNGEQQFVNHTFCEFFGVSEGEMRGGRWRLLVHPDDQARYTDEFMACVRDHRPFHAEVRVRRADGQWRCLESWARPRLSASGEFLGIVGTSADITARKAAERELQEARRKLDSALIAGEVGTYEWQVPEDRLWGDQNFARIFGIQLDATGAAPLAEYLKAIHPDDRAHVVEAVNRTVQTGCDYRAEYRILDGDQTRWVIARGKGQRDGSGRVVRFPGVVLDITDRRRAEVEREAIAAQLRHVLDTAATGLTHYDRDLRFLSANAAYARLVNRPLDQIVGRTIAEVIGDESFEVLRPYVQRVLSGERVEYDAQLTLSGDGTKHVHVSYAPDRGDDGQVVGWIASISDVTEIRKAHEALRASEERFRTLANNISPFAWMADPDGNLFWYNRRWYDYTGTTFEQMKGWGWKAVHHPDHVERVVEKFSRHVAAGEPWEDTFPLRGRDGTYRWFLSRAVPIRDEAGKVIQWFGTNTDITEQRETAEQLRQAKQEAERASESKSEFLAALSHELRTPLTPVLLTVSLLENRPDLSDEVREDVAAIRRNVELESRLISDLLDLTRIANGKLNLDMQEVDLHRLIHAAIDICQREASARVVVDLNATRHTVTGDGTRLQQIFWNLINNAIKFTGPEGTITVRSSDLAPERIRIEVIDTGAGIDSSVLPKLFTAFEQGEARSARQQAGLGLGLAISKKLAEAHGGTITVASAGRGCGSTFAVDLPVREPTPVAVGSSLPDCTAPGWANKRLSILLVEDHEQTLRPLERLLRGIGHRVTGVTSVASATATAARERFDLVICDLGLPDGSGLDVMRQLRQRYEGRAIALTGYGMQSDIDACRSAGFADHLTKPVDFAELRQAIERVARCEE